MAWGGVRQPGSAHYSSNSIVAIRSTLTNGSVPFTRITGVLEFLGAVGLLIPATRVAAAACLLLLMVAIFPANI